MFGHSIRRLQYKKLFLYGAYLTIMLLTVPASLIDYRIGNTTDAVIDLLYGLLTWTAYRFSFLRGDTVRAAIWLFWIATLIEFVYLYVHRINYDLIFSLLIPMIAFIAMSNRAILVNLALFYLLLAGYMSYGYFAYPGHPYLHDSSFILAFVVAHAFVLSFGFFYAMAIEEFVRRLEAANRTQSLLLSEVHHRVKNNLNLIASILGLQGQRRLHPEAAALLEDNRRRIESMAILHEILYHSDQAGEIDLCTYVLRLTDHIVRTETAGSVTMERHVVSVRLSMDLMIQIGILLNEMITNSIKHSADAQGHITVKIRFDTTQKGFALRYCDRAPTVDRERLVRGFGYNLIQLTVEHLRGTLEMTTEGGLCYTAVFPSMREERR